MARQLRIEYPSAIYHVTSRGNARSMIYADDKDREDFLRILALVVERYQWLCHAYCLMGNHYHLLIETPEGNLSKGMRQINGVYTQSYNRRHQRVGHLFQGRFKAILVEKESYLLQLCRYIVRNPVAANLCQSVDQWPWSSFRATAGVTESPDFLTVHWIWQQFSEKKESAQNLYRHFVEEGSCGVSPWDSLIGRIFLGSDKFSEELKARLTNPESLAEIPKTERYATRPDLQNLLGSGFSSRMEKASRIYQAHMEYGYTQKQIADFLNVHYSTVSRAIQRVEQNA